MPPPRISSPVTLSQTFSVTTRTCSNQRPMSTYAMRPLIEQHAPKCFKPVFQRSFTTSSQPLNWLVPNRKLVFKEPKGRPRMPTGGSVRGTTLVWGDFGLRMKDHDRRISAAQLKNGEDVIRRRLRGMNYRLFMRWHAGTAVYTKGNESRMGTGKGAFDYWAARMPVSRIIFELKADAHEQVVRDALRLAANKMPGTYEFVKKGDPPVMGITKLRSGVTTQSLMRPRRTVPAPSLDSTANRLPGSSAMAA